MKFEIWKVGKAYNKVKFVLAGQRRKSTTSHVVLNSTRRDDLSIYNMAMPPH